MIYTFTANPAIDMNITSDDILPGKVNRTREAVYSPNGKGLNVSFTLKRFGIDSKILGFFGGFSGKYILDTCKKTGFDIIPVKIRGTTRVNVFIQAGKQEYKLVNSGPTVDDTYQKQLLDILQKATDLDVLVISGSLAVGITEAYYEQILDICKAKAAEVILDISSPKLKDLLSYKPLLIKPNTEELNEIFGLNIETHQDARNACSLLYEMGAQHVFITSGEKGAYFYDGTTAFFCEPYPVKVKSSACAGDAFLGAFLGRWLYQRNNIEQALKIAAAAGATTAESNGLGDFSKTEDYASNITVHTI